MLARFTALGICATVFWLRADGVIGGANGLMLAALIGLVFVVIGIAAWGALRQLPGWKWVVASPLTIASITWLTLFALRPAELYFSPAETITPLLQLGYDTGDLCRTVAIAGVGCATWSIGLLFALPLVAGPKMAVAPVEGLSLRRRLPWLMIALGCLLAGALFMKQGGFSALINSAGALHENQGSGFYGQLGIWILIGTALTAFAVLVQGGASSATAKRILIVGAPLAAGSTLALGSRGLIASGLLAAGAIYLRWRTPSRRVIVLAGVAALLLAATLEFTAVVRTNASQADLGTAVERTTQTPIAYFQTSDLSSFDDFATMQQLIPSSISWLHGSSLIQIPAAFVPRGLWPGKPQPLDTRVTEYLYPGATAGTPITMQGELFWNFGMPGVALGSLMIGFLMGLSMFLLFRREVLSVILYSVLFPAVFAFLTRALATMTANTVIGLVGAGVVVVATIPSALYFLRASVSTSGFSNNMARR